MRPILLVGGAPRVRVDAVRDLVAHATGATAVALSERLAAAGARPDLLLARDAAPAPAAQRYVDRAGLETALGGWIAAHPQGVVVLSAAINDYDVAAVERRSGTAWASYASGEKLPSGGDEVLIRLRPAAKLIDQLRPRWGLAGPIVGFKYEAEDTVIAAAEALRQRTGAAVVVANSLCATVQALVDAEGVERIAERSGLVVRLAERLLVLAS